MPVRGRTKAVGIDLHDEEDVRLMELIKNGDHAAFETLVERNKNAVFNVAVRMLNGNVSEAEDVAQQVFIRVWTSAPRYENTAKFKTWLYTILKNLVYNETRRKSHHQEISLMVSNEDSGYQKDLIDSRNHSPQETMMQSEFEEATWAAIKALPKKQRMALSLRLQKNLSYEELCAIMGMSLSAVKSLIFRAREDLKVTLSPFMDKSFEEKDTSVESEKSE